MTRLASPLALLIALLPALASAQDADDRQGMRGRVETFVPADCQWLLPDPDLPVLDGVVEPRLPGVVCEVFVPAGSEHLLPDPDLPVIGDGTPDACSGPGLDGTPVPAPQFLLDLPGTFDTAGSGIYPAPGLMGTPFPAPQILLELPGTFDTAGSGIYLDAGLISTTALGGWMLIDVQGGPHPAMAQDSAIAEDPSDSPITEGQMVRPIVQAYDSPAGRTLVFELPGDRFFGPPERAQYRRLAILRRAVELATLGEGLQTR